MNKITPAYQRLNGSFGTLKANDEPIAEVTGVALNIEVSYSDVQTGLTTGKKMTGIAGNGTFKVTKAFSRSADYVAEVKAGRVPKIALEAIVADPDAVGAQQERVAVAQCNLTTIPVLNFDHNSLMNDEYPFNFDPMELDYLDRINPE